MPFDAPLAKWVLSHASIVVTHAEAVARSVHEVVGSSIETKVVPMPATLSVAPSALPSRPPLKLLCFGYVRRYKGFDLAVEAVKLLLERGHDVSLTIAGSVWEERDEWPIRVADPKLHGRVRLIDEYLPDTEVGRLLTEHHVVVLPYRSGTQSAVVPVAFAAGRPVVGTSVGGLAEAVRDGKSGRLVPIDDSVALADAIADVEMSLDRYAAAAAQTLWNWTDVANALLAPLDAL
jgi:glycosyltransferase involved in cell wall biosynthesis